MALGLGIDYFSLSDLLDHGDIPLDLARVAMFIGVRRLAPMAETKPSDFGIMEPQEEIAIKLAKQIEALGGINEEVVDAMRTVARNKGIKKL